MKQDTSDPPLLWQQSFLLPSWPLLLSNLFQQLYNTVDAVIVGKFVGVFSFSWLSIKCGLVSLPQGCDWRSFASVCMLCGIGLTVSIFIADLSYASMQGGAAGIIVLGSRTDADAPPDAAVCCHRDTRHVWRFLSHVPLHQQEVRVLGCYLS